MSAQTGVTSGDRTVNAFRWPLAAVLIATLAIQGCASTGGGEYATGAEPASNSNSGSNPVVQARTAADFAAVVAAVHKQMAPGGHWQYVNRSERNTIDQNFGEMQSLFDKYGSVDKMDDASKVRLFNDQEVINGILTQNDSNRLICSVEHPTGTHLSTKVCRTYGQIKENQRNAQDQMQQWNTLQGQTRQITESPAAGGGH
jgi:hypothetical protein